VAELMGYTPFENLAESSGVEHLRFFTFESRMRLVDLAHLVANDGGPLDQLDGSTPSLRILWSWFYDYARRGLPGVPEGVRSSGSRFLGVEPNRWERAQWVAEHLLRYAWIVARGFDPTCRWAVIPVREGKILIAGGNSVALRVGGSLLPIERAFRNMAVTAVNQDFDHDDPDPFTGFFEGWLARELPQTVPQVDLRILTQSAQVPLDDPMRLGPVGSVEAVASAGIDDYVELDSERGFEVPPLIRVLEQSGIEGVAGDIDRYSLTPGYVDWSIDSQGIAIELIFEGGRPKRLSVQAIGADPADWGAMKERLSSLI
jgi:hypothetical protein